MLSSIDDVLNPANYGGHVPVLLRETLELLSPRAGAKLLDGTFGGGGHTRALLGAAEGVTVVALDRDPEAVERAAEVEAEFGQRFRLVSMNFGDLCDLEESGFDGILFDFGLSSFQLDTAERGFSFREDAPVDMRMNPNAGISAAEFLETADEEALVRAVRNYGEEKRWRKVVQSILSARGTGRLQRTSSLSELIADAVGPGPRGRKTIHPATRSFQGIRVEVNDELNAIERGLPAAFERLQSGGTLAAISFHSLEDRIVKRFCRRMAGRPEHAGDSRTQDERQVLGKMISTRPIVPAEDEIAINPRSRSARMRAIRKL
ncbi:16S rRNA (cytosine(1402)-N(4))-methyltransferase RsmH [Coraliomargarita akajimensis]|uniref:Ribosomal RNA small subunit methyltransferase H n=1 Tax=Coraliomargarita akajimensis (strain DSM 45221 / IAM 15411 / JCM 23193 / KCTC 12865 / 04OKA010-24) TaxID=583355 RepID=D5EI35_CORAD|nr:16S rRNA (cytosine(1402)-N(4))-methyltransferase RsmH [Coraliomargarita akajimensis]ADE56075.1 S-adenosyl-methyltransferase MraW [Coraliomargarita akajimensis DSM 45221]